MLTPIVSLQPQNELSRFDKQPPEKKDSVSNLARETIILTPKFPEQNPPKQHHLPPRKSSFRMPGDFGEKPELTNPSTANKIELTWPTFSNNNNQF